MRYPKRITAVAVTVLLAVCAGLGWQYIRDYKLGNFASKVEIYVTPEMTPEDVIRTIEVKTTIRRPNALRKVFEKKKVATYIKPGHYTVSNFTSSVSLARMLNNGWESPVNLVLSGTLRLRDDISKKIAGQLMLPQDSIRFSFEDRVLLADYGFTPETVFALIIPDTYNCYWTVSTKQLYDMFKKSYDAFWTADNLRKAEKIGLTPLQVSILASIVNGESRYEPELPKIAGVYLNRHRKGMLLQADPTVCFCYDYSLDRVLLKHLKIDSPYNTYKYAGLPPGPICIPAKACLNAVLNADTSEGNIFFCANSDFSGTHVFTSSSAQHARNARAFQTELTRRQRAKK